MTRYDPHPQAHDDARSTRSGFTGRDESDGTAPEAHRDTPEPSAGAEGVSVVEQAFRVLLTSIGRCDSDIPGECSNCAAARRGAQAPADHGLLVSYVGRAEANALYELGEALTERDEARARVAELEAEVEWRQGVERDLLQRVEEVEARARRAEDALREVRALADYWNAHATRSMNRGPADRPRMFWSVAASSVYAALSAADQTSDATPSDTTTKED